MAKRKRGYSRKRSYKRKRRRYWKGKRKHGERIVKRDMVLNHLMPEKLKVKFRFSTKFYINIDQFGGSTQGTPSTMFIPAFNPGNFAYSSYPGLPYTDIVSWESAFHPMPYTTPEWQFWAPLYDMFRIIGSRCTISDLHCDPTGHQSGEVGPTICDTHAFLYTHRLAGAQPIPANLQNLMMHDGAQHRVIRPNAVMGSSVATGAIGGASEKGKTMSQYLSYKKFVGDAFQARVHGTSSIIGGADVYPTFFPDGMHAFSICIANEDRLNSLVSKVVGKISLDFYGEFFQRAVSTQDFEKAVETGIHEMARASSDKKLAAAAIAELATGDPSTTASPVRVPHSVPAPSAMEVSSEAGSAITREHQFIHVATPLGGPGQEQR